MKKRVNALAAVVALALVLAPGGVALGASQRYVQLDEAVVEIDLADGNTHQLTGRVVPSNASQKMVWRSGNKNVATVSKAGRITAVAIGKTTVSARPSSRSRWTKAVVRVTDSLAPTGLTLNTNRLNLTAGDKYQLAAEVGPDTAITTVRWWSSRSSVAYVAQDGQVLARTAGTATVRAISTRNPALYASVKVTVKNLPVPSKLTITPAGTKVERGDKLPLSVAITPVGANPAVAWTTSNKNIATVDQTGLVTAKKTGTVKIKVASKAKKTVYTIRTLKVVDTKTVTGVVIESDDSVLLAGGTLKLNAKVLPSTADQTVKWSTGNAAAATVSDNGLVQAVAPGSATITASAGGKTASQRVVVLDATPVTVLPAQVTSADGLSGNLAKLDDIQRYAIEQLDALYVTGAIGKSEASARKTIVLNAFRMARFPWMSSKTVKYWSGGSRFKKNVVYYGIPYTQTHRTYNASKLLRSGAFKARGNDAHYTASMADRNYPGNDCSSFVSMSYWGLGTRYSYLRSWEMKSSGAYRTIAKKSSQSSYLELRPGDFFVRDGHVAMFLYYASSLRNRIMIIQQGGRDTLNTVGCYLKPISYYSADGRYVARRKRSFA